jgi:hypothetical protein
MAAIITEQFRRNSAKLLLADIANVANNYYVGLGKSDSWVADEQLTNWVVPSADGTNGEAEEIKSNLITLIKAETINSRLVIPRVNYRSGTRYKAYTPYDENCFYPETISGVSYLPCYAVNIVGGNVAIYLCLRAPNNDSQFPPTDATSYTPRSYGSDNYIWALIDVFSTTSATIDTDQYISISTGSVEAGQTTKITNESGGILYGFTIVDGGSGYTAGSFNVTFTPYTSAGPLTAIVCPALVTAGSITSISLPAISSATGIINGIFDFSNSSTGSGAKILANITPTLGLAHTPSNILPSWFIGIAAKAIDDISSDGFYIPYRQVSVLRNVSHDQSGSNPSTLGALKYLKLSAARTELALIEPGTIISFVSSQTKALFDSYATKVVGGTTEYRVYYHQNSSSGYGKVPSSGAINISTNTNIAYSTALNNEYVPGTGELVFVENRKPIVRAQSQTEEIKIIIQL